MSAVPKLEDILVKIVDIPSLPTVVARLTRLIADPKTTASDINSALSADPGLVTRILKLVNSSYYGFSRRITTITNAVVILGFNQVRNLALSTFIFDKFAGSGGNSGFDLNGFWRHSVGTAFLCAQIARRIDAKLEEDAFICGLLHDLGKFIMVQHAPEHMSMIMDMVRRENVIFHEAERKVLGYDHAMLGSVVLERWKLPQTLVDVVRNHHYPLDAPPASRRLCCAAQTAEITARALLMGNAGDGMIPRLPPGVWAATGLDWERFEDIIRRALEDYSKSGALFSL